jgi:microcystin-dependent protein
MEGPFLGQIVLNAGGRVPSGWHACDGTLLRVTEYTLLFSLLGTKYGGDGMTTFGLPKLSGVGNTTYVIAIEGEFPGD